MATIAFCIFNYQGELNSTLKLAKKLSLLGHEVLYLGLPDYEEKVCSYGFKFLPILEKWFPKGFIQQLEINNSNKLQGLLNQLRYKKSLNSLINSLIKGENREIHTLLKTFNPKLLVISTYEELYSTFIGMIAYECQVKSIYFTDMFTSLPLSNLLEKDIVTSFDNNFIAKLFNLKNKYIYQKLLKATKKIIALLSKTDFSEEDMITKFAINRKIPLDLLDLSQAIPLKLTHLVLCPKELDLPNILREKCYYAEASIDLQREEPSFVWSNLDKNKSLIYCSLGTTVNTFSTLGINRIKQLFQNVIDAVSLKNEYQLVLSISDYISVEDFEYIPENIIVVNKAPQLGLLKKASIAIIAGGINTIKECIFCGVPMIVFPVWADQPDNAERIEYHGLGVVADVNNTSTNLIVDLIETIENDLLLKQRLKIWGEKFQDIEKSGMATQFILEMLEDKHI
ncbi:UDP-glucuronosyltransferase-like glycosyl transferase [Nostoc sp. C057]|uniref:nucleotide disphospho-sugar-binding domain-containing protein n=1 Tax=Nostoc sp. C057 TaxID=2576903 RepID=UPI0015C34AD3|nr:nucleotide disphospho-sugar-binding domain-containing protein [Nostoc sp. C057]QLE49524.1 UDP-glucuronosyltransferase-like glycosyl transferase [Nostoc sp. C057]